MRESQNPSNPVSCLQALISTSQLVATCSADFDEDQLEDVILCMVETKVTNGDVIIQEGEDGDNFYVIERGIFEASKNGKSLFKYENKGSFGELALMYNCPRAASITVILLLTATSIAMSCLRLCLMVCCGQLIDARSEI